MTAVHPASSKQRQNHPDHKSLMGGLVLTCLVIGTAIWGIATHLQTTLPTASLAPQSPQVRLVYAVHWGEKSQLDGLQKYLNQYTALHPNISFTVQTAPYDQYAGKLKALSEAGAAPDIYQIHSDWAAESVHNNLLASVPDDVQADIKKNYSNTDSVTVGGQIRGIPTEINDYAILYNKNLFKKAGIIDAQGNALPPKTWSELISDATKLTKKDSQGNFTQYGFATLKDNDWQMVDPFLSLLYSTGGHYLSADLSESLFDSSYGVQALNGLLSLQRSGSTNLGSDFFDFGRGKVGIVVSPPWTKNTFKAAFGSNFDSTVGVAPLPNLGTQKSTQYSWLTGVTATSQHQTEAWNFLRWFTSDVQAGTNTTRCGDLLAGVIGTIPSRKLDQKNHPSLQDPFTKTFVEQLSNSRPEPSVIGTSAIRTALMNEIQAAWIGKKTAQQALEAAAVTSDKILKP